MHILDNIYVWQLFRRLLNDIFSLYSKRISAIKSLGINDQMSVLEVGCGTGEFARMTRGRYLGIDMNNQYINYAKKLYGNDPLKQFLREDLTKTKLPKSEFDVVLLIDFTHHVSDEDLNHIFKELNTLNFEHIVIYDPVKQSSNNLWGRMLIFLDRGKYIRSEENQNKLIANHFKVKKIKKLHLMGVECICVLACPQIKA